MAFFTVVDLAATEMLPGITRSAVYLNNVMLTFFDFEPEAVVPEHSHPHEQITYVFDGAMVFTLGEDTRTLRAGDGVCIPPNVPHSAHILNAPTRAVDAWHPVREDYK